MKAPASFLVLLATAACNSILGLDRSYEERDCPFADSCRDASNDTTTIAEGGADGPPTMQDGGEAGSAEAGCSGGKLPCSSGCVPSDDYNCGACGNACLGGHVCIGGTCKCPVGTTLCGATCVTVDGSDANNCGACMHSCLGSTCTNGWCDPVTLAPAGAGAPGAVAESVNGLTTDGSIVYWTYDRGSLGSNGDGVLSCPGIGCGMSPHALYTGTGNYFGTLVLGVGKLYWIASSGLQFIDELTTGGGTPGSIGTFSITGGIATDGQNVYFGAPRSGSPSILVCDPASCTVAGQFIVATTANIVGGSFIYWTDSALNSVRRCAPGMVCVGPTDLAATTANPAGLAVDDTNVYWFDASGLKQCSLSGCGTPIILASGQAATGTGGGPAANDGAYVYWVNGASILRATVGTPGSDIEVATGQLGADNIAVDATSVYWSVGGGAIMKLAK